MVAPGHFAEEGRGQFFQGLLLPGLCPGGEGGHGLEVGSREGAEATAAGPVGAASGVCRPRAGAGVDWVLVGHH